MMKMAKFRLPKMWKSDKKDEDDHDGLGENIPVRGTSSSLDVVYPRAYVLRRKESVDDMMIPSRSSSTTTSESISRSSSMEFNSRAEEERKYRALELAVCYSPRKVRALRRISRTIVPDESVDTIPDHEPENSKAAQEVDSGGKVSKSPRKKRRRKKTPSVAGRRTSDEGSGGEDGVDSPSRKRRTRNGSRKGKGSKEKAKSTEKSEAMSRSNSDEAYRGSESKVKNLLGIPEGFTPGPSTWRGDVTRKISNEGSDSSQSESSDGEVTFDTKSSQGIPKIVQKKLSSSGGIEPTASKRRKSEPERPLTLAVTPPMQPLSGDSMPSRSPLSGTPKSQSDYARLNVKTKKAFAQALLRGNCQSKSSLLQDITSPKHIAWLLKWLQSKDAMSLPAARCLACMAYPDEMVAGLQEKILEEKALHLILAFVKTGEVEVHRAIRWEDLELGDKIAKGAGGIIYKAIWRRGVKRKGVEVVAKVATENMLAFNTEEHRFELGIMTMLNHKNVMRTYGGCTKGPNYFMIMPLMDCGSLESKLTTVEGASWDWIAKLRTALGICNGMCYLHENNVIHRDLKSANVLLSSSGDIQVTDFGVSRVVDDSQMTMNIGTTAWIAPEVFESGTYSLSADVYSFSIVLWEIVTGETPFKGVANWSIPGKVVKGERPPMPGQCPQSIKTLLSKCWDEDPANRPSFPTVKEELYELYKRLRRLAV